MVDGPSVEPGRRAGLETRQGEAMARQALGEPYRRPVAHAAGRPALQTEVDLAAQEGPGRENDGCRPISLPAGEDAGDTAVRRQDLLHLRFGQGQAGLLREQRPDGQGVEPSVGLRARTLDGGTLAAIEDAELDSAGIDRPAHQAVERVDLADQMAPAQPADGGVAGHGPDGQRASG